MGSQQTDHLMVVLPWPEPKDIMAEIRRKHPQFKVTYVCNGSANAMNGKSDIKDGMRVHQWVQPSVMSLTGS